MPRPPARPQPTLRLKGSSKVQLGGLPKFTGSPIQVSFKSQLTNFRGQLLSKTPHKGTAVHAASFIRRREIILESQLTASPGLLRHILLHELFHFVWPRLNNTLRQAYARLLLAERRA